MKTRREHNQWFLPFIALGIVLFAPILLPADWEPLWPFVIAASWAMCAQNAFQLELSLGLGVVWDLMTATPLGTYSFALVVSIYLLSITKAWLSRNVLWRRLVAYGCILILNLSLTELTCVIMRQPYGIHGLAQVMSTVVLWPLVFYIVTFKKYSGIKRLASN